MTSLHKQLRHLISFHGGPGTNVDQAVADIEKVYADAGYATVRKDPYRDRDETEYTQYTINYADGSGEFVRIPVAK